MAQGENRKEKRSNSSSGFVKIHDDNVVEDLLINEDNTPLMRSASVTGSPLRKKIKPNRTVSSPVLGRNSIYDRATKGAWLDKPSIETVQARSDLECRGTREMCTEVLNNEKVLSKAMNSLLINNDKCNFRKKELLHKKWTDRVYEPIIRNIVNLMESPEYDKLNRKKSIQYQEYLTHVNRKGHVFLDTFTPDEYFPLGLQSSSLVAVTKGLQDPLFRTENARYEEDRIVMQCLAGAKLTKDELNKVREILLPPLPLSRKDINSYDWLTVPLVSIESPVRTAARSRMKSSKYRDQIVYDTWVQPQPSAKKETTVTQMRKVASPRGNSQASQPRTSTTEFVRTTGHERGNKPFAESETLISLPMSNRATQTLCVY